jgi:tetratricopeptide (TPR) repeat protein
MRNPTILTSKPDSTDRLVSWKSIAAYLHCDVRTAQRWEQERALPVYRLPGKDRSSVFAYRQELDAWLVADSTTNSNPAALNQTLPTPPISLSQEQESTLAPEINDARSAVLSKQSIIPGMRNRLWLLAAAVLILAVCLSVFLRAHSSAENRAQKTQRHTPPPAARNFYLEGQYDRNTRSEQGLHDAIDNFTQAIILDPNYAEAYAGLAESYDLLPEYSGDSYYDAMPKAIAAAQKAIQLDDSLPEAHKALAFALFWWQWDFKSGFKEYELSIQLNPNDAETHHWYATALTFMNNPQKGFEEMEKARQLDPGSKSIRTDQAYVLLQLGRSDEAISLLEDEERRDPNFYAAPHLLSEIYQYQRRYDRFVQEFDRAAQISHHSEMIEAAAAARHGYEQGGEKEMFKELYTVENKTFKDGKGNEYQLAYICANLGRSTEAVQHLRNAKSKHDYMVFDVRYPTWAPALDSNTEFLRFRAEVQQLALQAP